MPDACLLLEACGAPARSRLAALLCEIKDEDPLAPVTVVVPTSYAAVLLRRRLGEARGLFNVRFLVFERLAEYLGASLLAQQGKQPSSPLLELAVLHRLTAAASGVPAFAELAQHTSVLGALRDACHALDRLPPAALQQLAAVDALRAQLVHWYMQFRDCLRHHYRPEALARAAAAAVADGTAAGVLRDLGQVIVYLPADLSPGQLALVQALGRAGRCTVLAGLVGEEGPDAPVRQSVAALTPVLGPAQPPAVPPAPIWPQHLLCAPDAYEEVRWVVRFLVQQAESGVPFSRMAVFYRQPSPYAELLAQQLGLAGIPVAGPSPLPARDTPAGRLLLQLLDALATGWRREAVLRWLSECPVAEAPGVPLTAAMVACWERLSRQAGIVGGLGQWQQRLHALRHRQHELAVEERAALERLLALVQRLAASAPPPAGSPWRTYAAWAEGLLRRWASDPESWPPEHRDSFDGVQRVLQTLAGLDVVAAGTELATFRTLLEEALAEPLGRLGPTGAGVLVAPLAVAPGLDLEVACVVGMAEGAFPPPPQEDPLLPDRVRVRLGVPALPPRRMLARHGERRLYLAALAAARYRLATYPRLDPVRQRPQHPAPWLLEAAARLHGRTVGGEALPRLHDVPWLSVVHSPLHALAALPHFAPADLHDYDLASVARWQAAGQDLAAHFLAAPGQPLARALRLERQRRAHAFTAWDGRLCELAGRSARLALPQGGPLSPTALERWVSCPFRYFLEDVLALKPLCQPQEPLLPEAAARGGWLHEVLARFLRAVMEQGTLPAAGEPWAPQHRELLLATAEAVFAEVEAGGVPGRPLLWEALKHEMRHDLLAFLAADSRWRAEQQTRPLAVEGHFGMPLAGSWPAVTLRLPPGETVQFCGRIDRIDVDATGSRAVVIDYKTGAYDRYRVLQHDPLGGGRFLQLPIYALAARAALPQLQSVDAQLWFVTRRGGLRRQAVALEGVADRLHDVLGCIASGIRQGLFPARPLDCKACPFDRLCPATRQVLWEKKAQDPVLAPYLSLFGLAEAEETPTCSP